MTTLFTYVRDIETDDPYFAIVADDAGAEYVWPKGDDPWWESFDDRMDLIMLPDEPEPEDAAGWLNLAARHLGPQFETDPPFDDASNASQAKRLASNYLDAIRPERTIPPHPDVSGLMQTFDQVSTDYPGFGDDPESMGSMPEAMSNMVLMALGPIDPDGPYGWIIRAQDGQPAEGDEDAFVHFPGTMTFEVEKADESEEDSE